MKQFNREGAVRFSDASLHVTEEGLGNCKGFDEREAWEEAFRSEVFKPMVWLLRKLGWATEIDAEDFADTKARHGLKFAQKWTRRKRLCSHGDLKGEIYVTGRCIEFKMWQGVNTPTRPDHGGRYEHNLEGVMPYLLRLRMERTRRKLRDYLLHRCTGYTFEDKSPKTKAVGPGGMTALEKIIKSVTECWHYKPELGHAEIHDKKRGYSADGVQLEHGKTKAYSFDYKGRPIFGTVYYNTNGNWIVHTGKYDSSWHHYHNQIYVKAPENLRHKRNDDRRRRRLEEEMAKAIKAMDFLRAHKLKGILFPTDEQLFVVKHEDGMYHRTGFRGYTSSLVDAGKFMAPEVKGWEKHNTVIPLQEAS